MDPCREDKNNADGAGPADRNAGPDDATIVGPHELIRMPRRDAAGRDEPSPPRDARADGAPPLVDMTCERLYRHYEMPRSRSAPRRRSRPWKWIIGAGAGGASIAAAIGVVWAVGTARLDDGAASQRALVDEVGALRREVATLESSVAKKPADKAAAAVNAAQLRAAIAQLEARLDAGAGKTSTKLTQVASQLEKLDAQSARESAAKLSEITERLDRLHHQVAAISMETTGSIQKPTPAPAAAPPVPFRAAAAASPPKEIRAKETQAHLAEQRRPLDNWVLRGVHEGTALVEGAQGLREVAPGSVLPGAGRVKSIERHGANWVVITTAGVIDPED
jgi:hypothetical protein